MAKLARNLKKKKKNRFCRVFQYFTSKLCFCCLTCAHFPLFLVSCSSMPPLWRRVIIKPYISIFIHFNCRTFQPVRRPTRADAQQVPAGKVERCAPIEGRFRGWHNLWRCVGRTAVLGKLVALVVVAQRHHPARPAMVGQPDQTETSTDLCE